MTWLLTSVALVFAAGHYQPASGPAPRVEASATTGTLEDAPYRIEIPPRWNGDLVMLFHGYEIKGQPREDPWPRMPGHGIEVFLGKGYAVALSGYSAQGWAVEQAMADSMRLREYFETLHGKPGRTYAVGYSMGGHLTLATLERYPEAYDGGLSLCGANMPATSVFQIATDALASFDALFPGVLALGPAGLSDPSSPASIDGEKVEAALKSDPAKSAYLSNSTGIDAEHLPGTLWLYYSLLREMMDRAGGFPSNNTATVYTGFGDDSAFNQAIRRYAGDPEAIAYARAHATLTGEIEDPVVLLSNAYDDILSTRNTAIYPGLVAKSERSHLLRQLSPVGRGHCNFEDAHISEAFEMLVNWVESGSRP